MPNKKEDILEEFKKIFKDEKYLKKLRSGERYTVSLNEEGIGVDVETCCDCGLYHFVVYIVDEGEINVYPFRADDETTTGRRIDKLLKKIEKFEKERKKKKPKRKSPPRIR